MHLVQERVYKPIHDIMRAAAELNTIARQHEQEGYTVERSIAGAVILKLNDGEVHFVPSGSSIKQLVFAN